MTELFTEKYFLENSWPMTHATLRLRLNLPPGDYELSWSGRSEYYTILHSDWAGNRQVEDGSREL